MRGERYDARAPCNALAEISRELLSGFCAELVIWRWHLAHTQDQESSILSLGTRRKVLPV